MALDDDILANLKDPDKVLDLILSPVRDLERWGKDINEMAKDLQEAGDELKKGKTLHYLEEAAKDFLEVGAVADEGAARQAAAQRATAQGTATS